MVFHDFSRYLYSLEEEERETTHESLHADTCRYKSLNEIDSVMGRYIEAPHGFFRVPDRKSPRIVAIEPAGPPEIREMTTTVLKAFKYWKKKAWGNAGVMPDGDFLWLIVGNLWLIIVNNG